VTLEIHPSAHKHGVRDADIVHAMTYEVREMAAEKKSYGRTPSGVEITEEYVAKAVAEAEAGYDLSTLRRLPGRPPMGTGPAAVLPVRLDPELRAALDERVAADQSTASEVVREALRRYLQAS